jgi:hypothetical protein
LNQATSSAALRGRPLYNPRNTKGVEVPVQALD